MQVVGNNLIIISNHLPLIWLSGLLYRGKGEYLTTMDEDGGRVERGLIRASPGNCGG